MRAPPADSAWVCVAMVGQESRSEPEQKVIAREVRVRLNLPEAPLMVPLVVATTPYHEGLPFCAGRQLGQAELRCGSESSCPRSLLTGRAAGVMLALPLSRGAQTIGQSRLLDIRGVPRAPPDSEGPPQPRSAHALANTHAVSVIQPIGWKEPRPAVSASNCWIHPLFNRGRCCATASGQVAFL